MKLAEITTMTDAELSQLITAQRNELTKAVLESRTKEIKNVKTQAAFKRTIARALTVQRQRQLTALTQENAS